MTYTAPERGYIQVFVANESDEEVFFDQMVVEHIPQLIVQENHYYPFGLELSGLSKRGKPEHRWKFQGQEEQTEFGLNWSSFKWRNADVALGRFFSVDPLAEQYIYLTPYQHASNNPASKIELEGLEGVPVQEIHGIGASSANINIGIYDQNSFRRISNDNGRFTLHAITSGPNAGNFVAKQYHGRDGNGVLQTSFTHIVGSDRVDDFASGNFSTGGWRSSIAAFGKSIGGRTDGNVGKAAVDNLKSQWTNPVSLGLGAAMTALSLPRTSLVSKTTAKKFSGRRLSQAEAVSTKGGNGGEWTKVGRWMSTDEYTAMQQTGKVQEGGGGVTFATTSGPDSFRAQTAVGNVYIEYEVPINSLLKGGQPDWVKNVGPGANNVMKKMLQKKGGDMLPSVRNLSDIIEVKK